MEQNKTIKIIRKIPSKNNVDNNHNKMKQHVGLQDGYVAIKQHIDSYYLQVEFVFLHT